MSALTGTYEAYGRLQMATEVQPILDAWIARHDSDEARAFAARVVLHRDDRVEIYDTGRANSFVLRELEALADALCAGATAAGVFVQHIDNGFAATIWTVGDGTRNKEVRRGAKRVCALPDGSNAQRHNERVTAGQQALAQSKSDGERYREEVERVGPMMVPILLVGNSAAIRERAARDIHAASGRDGELRRRLIGAPDGATVFLRNVCALTPEEQQLVPELAFAGQDIRLVCGIAGDPMRATMEGKLAPELYYRLSIGLFDLGSLDLEP